MPAEEVGMVFGDGLGTENDDLREAQAVRGMLSGAAAPFTATTSAIGYTGAVSGVFSLIHSLFAIRSRDRSRPGQLRRARPTLSRPLPASARADAVPAGGRVEQPARGEERGHGRGIGSQVSAQIGLLLLAVSASVPAFLLIRLFVRQDRLIFVPVP